MDKHISGDWQGKMIGRYQLLQLLGRGGMSEVWLATDTQLLRQVALKLLPTVLTNDRAYLQDFAYEARAAASLEHPHILGIHDFGEQEGERGEVIPYLVMPHVPGGTLRERLSAAQGPLPIQESLRYLRQAAQAIDYAHSKQILHRDIKPANMLLREDWLLLADFGIAKVLNSGATRGQTYAGAGTPEYMAPEQILGQAQAASDRYSLAVVAYQLFTGRQPFHGVTPSDTIAQQLQAPLPPPRQLNPQIPPAVENLLVMALSRQIEARPPSCTVLVSSLQQAWMNGVQTDHDPEVTHLAPWSRRLQQVTPTPGSPLVSGSSSPAFSAGPGASSPGLQPVAGVSSPLHPGAPTGSLQSGATPVLPTPLTSDAQPQTPFVSRTMTDYGATLPSERPTGDPFATFSMANPAPSPTLPPRTFEQKVGRRTILIGGTVAAVAVIGGGAVALAALQGHQPVVHQGPISTLTPVLGPRELVAGVPVLSLTGHTDSVWTASWNPNGRYLMTAGKDGNIMLWDIGTNLKQSAANPTLATPRHSWTVAGIKFANLTDGVCWTLDGQKIVAGNDFTDKAYVLDAFGTSDNPTVYNDVDASASGGSAIYTDVSPGPLKGQFTILNETQAQVWKIGQTDRPEINYNNGTSSDADNISKANWSRDGKTLAALNSVLSATRRLLLWKSTDRLHPQSLNFPPRPKDYRFFVLADTVAWSPVEERLLLTSNGDVGVLWDARQGKPLLTLGTSANASTPVVGQMCWSPNGRYIAGSYTVLGTDATTALNPQIVIWDIKALLASAASPTDVQMPALTFVAQGSIKHTMSITDLEWSPGGRYLATSSLDKTVLLWKVDGAS